MGLLNHWARMHRNARAFAGALSMLGAIAFMGVFKCQEATDPIVANERETGLLVATDSGLGGNTILGTIALDSGDTVQLWLTPPYPEPGQRVPLQVEVRSSGERGYWFDANAFLTGDPGR